MSVPKLFLKKSTSQQSIYLSIILAQMAWAIEYTDYISTDG